VLPEETVLFSSDYPFPVQLAAGYPVAAIACRLYPLASPVKFQMAASLK
jgi:hypothetical protein